MSIMRVVAITGCDSGLGWAIAARSAREGLVTVAGMYNGVDTKAAEGLRKLCAHPYSLDVTNLESIAGFRDYVKCLLNDNPNYKLHAIVNNAGVMTIGDYEWQTPAMIESCINVNLLGTMRVTTAFLPDLRKSALESTGSSKPRIINVASHCGLQPLPGFGAYSASKAGVLALTKALRMEHRRHGLSAVAFVPAMSIMRVVAITGCDSGLGWAIAARSAREGLVTVAGMYNGVDTKAAEGLRKLCAHPYSLDVTNLESIAGFRDYVKCLLNDNPNYKLHAIVNNAGVMTIGDYEWQTPAMIESCINVNLLGTMRVTTAFLPDLRKSALESTGSSKPRIINVASHCGLQPLPGFGAYSASKAGVLALTKALRMEHRRHGLSAVAFVPGGFITSSNLISSQGARGKTMLEHLNDEQKSFYAKRITTLSNYLQSASTHNAGYDSLKDENIIETFVKALTDDNPKDLYKVESWRYMFYYNLLKLPLPEATLGWLVKKFLNFPE